MENNEKGQQLPHKPLQSVCLWETDFLVTKPELSSIEKNSSKWYPRVDKLQNTYSEMPQHNQIVSTDDFKVLVTKLYFRLYVLSKPN